MPLQRPFYSHFNPRTPCGVRPSFSRFLRPGTHFNPRTPCGVRRLVAYRNRPTHNFNPRTPCGVRLCRSWYLATSTQFQSTHPLRGATKGEIFVVIHFHIISIHAPLAGCDRRTSARGPAHRPYFNPRTPCGVRRANGTVNRSRAYFNPRTPCGVRHLHLQYMSWLEYFNPRTPCGVRLSIFSINKSLTNFNPRTPCGVRLIDVEKQVFEAIFQSTHPLRGATLKVLRGAVTKVISIHAPLAGCDERKIITHKEDMKFQSTHPLRGATAWLKKEIEG